MVRTDPAPPDAGGGGPPLRVVVVDDHPVVRGGLVALLATIDGVEVVAECGTGREAVDRTLELLPDLVVMDLRMPTLDGVSATRAIRARLPHVQVLVLTMFDEDSLVADALAAGARGYLLKGAQAQEIEQAVRAVASGTAVLAPTVADRVLRGVRRPAWAPLPALTPREHEVLHLVARGLGNAGIAATLHLAPKTVGNHITAILAKLGVSTRAEAIAMARDAGVGER